MYSKCLRWSGVYLSLMYVTDDDVGTVGCEMYACAFIYTCHHVAYGRDRQVRERETAYCQVGIMQRGKKLREHLYLYNFAHHLQVNFERGFTSIRAENGVFGVCYCPSHYIYVHLNQGDNLNDQNTSKLGRYGRHKLHKTKPSSCQLEFPCTRLKLRQTGVATTCTICESEMFDLGTAQGQFH